MGLISSPLDDVLSSRAKVRLLRLFSAEPDPMSAREAARQIGMAKRSADLALRDLVQLGVIMRKEFGRQPMYLLNPDHFLVRHSLRPLFIGCTTHCDDQRGGERGAISELFDTLRDAVEEPGCAGVLWAALYGSTATGNDDAESDIDLAVVVTDDEAMERMQNRLAELLPLVRLRIGRALSPMVITRTQLRALDANGHPLVASLAAGRVIGGSIRDLRALLHGAG